MEPFVIEIPENIMISDHELCKKMRDYCNVEYLAIRRIPDRNGPYYSFEFLDLVSCLLHPFPTAGGVRCGN